MIMSALKTKKASRQTSAFKLSLEGVEYVKGPPPPVIRKNIFESDITTALKELPLNEGMRFVSGKTAEEHHLAQSSITSRLANLRRSHKLYFVTRSTETENGQYFLTIYRVPEPAKEAA